MSIARVINRTLKREIGHYVAWMPLSDSYAVGDYGAFRGGLFQKLGNVAEFGVDPRPSSGRDVAFTLASSGVTTLRTVAGAEVPVFPDNPVQAELTLGFSKGDGVFLRASARVEEMTSVDAVAHALSGAMAADGRSWKRRWKVVRKVYTAKDPLLLAAAESNTEFRISATADVLKAVELAGGHGGLAVTGSRSTAFHLSPGTGPLALDLFSLGWFGGAALETAAAMSHHLDDAWPEEPPDDPSDL